MEATQTSFSNLQQQHAQLQTKFEEAEIQNAQLRSELANKTQIIQQMKAEVVRNEEFVVSSNIIVTFSPEHFRVNGSTVTRINSTGWVGCFTKPVSKGIHRMSIRNPGTDGIMFGVLNAAKTSKYLTFGANKSSEAAMMNNADGYLYSAGKYPARNIWPREGQEWSAEADLEKRTLHFFIDGIQQQHHFMSIPVPLVFAIDAFYQDV
ncbi:hypothetical protein BLNAU_17335 [Blattamonas nauphoetae]|uniref:Uncharacterized protein n=1 Tax=Blattamonas nauphoetae TaxID=2049346 RepID=A0ABQ9X8V9_9EUKA|nr:hypothetical protein BLNAU_17335 [Blattamonas nauphoetae]